MLLASVLSRRAERALMKVPSPRLDRDFPIEKHARLLFMEAFILLEALETLAPQSKAKVARLKLMRRARASFPACEQGICIGELTIIRAWPLSRLYDSATVMYF